MGLVDGVLVLVLRVAALLVRRRANGRSGCGSCLALDVCVLVTATGTRRARQTAEPVTTSRRSSHAPPADGDGERSGRKVPSDLGLGTRWNLVRRGRMGPDTELESHGGRRDRRRLRHGDPGDCPARRRCARCEPIRASGFARSVILVDSPAGPGSGGSAWESNPAPPRQRGATDFEDREGHRAPFASINRRVPVILVHGGGDGRGAVTHQAGLRCPAARAENARSPVGRTTPFQNCLDRRSTPRLVASGGAAVSRRGNSQMSRTRKSNASETRTSNRRGDAATTNGSGPVAGTGAHNAGGETRL